MSHSLTIGILLPFLLGYNSSQAYYGPVLTGIYTAAQQRGVRLILVEKAWRSTQHMLVTERQHEHSWALAQNHVDGWISIIGAEGIAKRAQSGKPIVTVSESYPDLSLLAVLPDNYTGTREAIRHLIRHGHTRIGFVGKRDIIDMQQRYEGYRSALAEYGLFFDPDLVFDTEHHAISETRNSLRHILKDVLRCTALFCSGSGTALELMAVAQEAGYRVPEDIALIGGGDDEQAQYVSPSLTTVDFDFEALGQIAIEVVLAQLAGETPPPITYAPARLVPRCSCGCTEVTATTAIGASSTVGVPHHPERVVEPLTAYRQPVQAMSLSVQLAEQWTAHQVLLHGVDAAIQGVPGPSKSMLAQAWQQLVAMSDDLAAVSIINWQVEQAARQRLAHVTHDSVASPRLETFLLEQRIEFMRAYCLLAHHKNLWHLHLIEFAHTISDTLLSESSYETYDLTWLGYIPVHWACLGLWTNHETDQSSRMMIAATYHQDSSRDLPRRTSCDAADFPPEDLLDRLSDPVESPVTLLLSVHAHQRHWGVLTVGLPYEIPPFSMGMWVRLLASAMERRSLLKHIDRLTVPQVKTASHEVACWYGPATLDVSAQPQTSVDLRFVETGAITYLIDGQQVQLPAGHTAVCWNSLPSHIVAYEPGTCYYRVAVPLAWVLQQQLPMALTEAILRGKPLIDPTPDDAGVNAALFRDWYRIVQTQPLQMKVVLLEIEARLHRLGAALEEQAVAYQESMIKRPVSRAKLEKAQQMAQFIAEHYTEPIRKEDIARVVGLHPNYAIRLFRTTFGMSPVTYITRYRIAHAQRLLLTSDASITDIALDAGFGSSTYFAKVFKQVFGLTPSEFAKPLPHRPMLE